MRVLFPRPPQTPGGIVVTHLVVVVVATIARPTGGVLRQAQPVGGRNTTRPAWLMKHAIPVAYTDSLRKVASGPTKDVLTNHNDGQRTGTYTAESMLSPLTVRPMSFGKLFSRKVSGQIYAQPLYLSGLTLGDGSTHNVVFVATMHNFVYAFDADDPTAAGDTPLWLRPDLGNPVPYNFMRMVGSPVGAYNIQREIGITSTPVVDAATRTIYLVAKVCEEREVSHCKGSRKVNHYLHALDVATGADRSGSPVRIAPTCEGTGAGAKNGVLTFDQRHHLQRPALLLANDRIYVGFGSHQDQKPFHGWLVAFDKVSLQQVGALCTTPDGDEGSIWQAGSGPAADANGNVYVMTGNGSAKSASGGAQPRDFPNSFLKLSPELKVLDWFTPTKTKCLNTKDIDLGSAGPAIIPNSDLLIGGGKEGVFYLLDANHLGGLQPPDSKAVDDHAPCAHVGSNANPPPLQAFQATPNWQRPPLHLRRIQFSIPMAVFGYHHIHGSPVIWDDGASTIVFSWAERDYLRAFRLDRATSRFRNVTPPGDKPTADYLSGIPGARQGMPGAAMSLSGAPPQDQGTARTAVLWASMPLKDNAFIADVEGVLRAFDASTLIELWNSRQDPRDGTFLFSKYCPPTIANGKVFLATFSDRLDVYGLRASDRRQD